MNVPAWRTQTPAKARRDFLRVLGPWVSTTLELRRQGLLTPTLDRCDRATATGHLAGYVYDQGRRAA